MIKQIYNDILAAISSKCPEIRIVDIDTRQIDTAQPTVEMPAVLLTIGVGVVEDADCDNQMSAVSVSARVAIDGAIGETSNITPESWRDEALAKLDIIDSVSRALHNHKGLAFVSSQPETRTDGLLVYRLTFKGFYEIEY